jgi:hypothetical protein
MFVNCSKYKKQLYLYLSNITVKGINIFCNNCNIEDLDKRGLLNPYYEK